MGADAESSCTESRTDPWSAPTNELWAPTREIDVAAGIEAINRATLLNVRSVRSAWAGLRTFAPDRVPVVGFDPDAAGFFWCAGQGGTGIQTSPAIAGLTADLISGQTPQEFPADLVTELHPNRFRPGPDTEPSSAPS